MSLSLAEIAGREGAPLRLAARTRHTRLVAGGANVEGGALAVTVGLATALWCWRQTKSDTFRRRTWDTHVSMGLDFERLDPKTGQLRSAGYAWRSRRIFIGSGFGGLVALLGIVSITIALLG